MSPENKEDLTNLTIIKKYIDEGMDLINIFKEIEDFDEFEFCDGNILKENNI